MEEEGGRGENEALFTQEVSARGAEVAALLQRKDKVRPRLGAEISLLRFHLFIRRER